MERRSAVRNEASYALESLEERRLLSRAAFGPTATLIGQDKAVSDFSYLTGSGESIVVIDTGIDFQDPLLGGGIGSHKKVIAGYDFVTNGPLTGDPDGHGTGVTGVIGANRFTFNRRIYQGIAPEAHLIGLRIDDSVDNPTSGIINQALQWVLDHRVKYNIVSVNLSEGDGVIHGTKTFGPNTTLLQKLNAAGVFVAAASGNAGSSSGVEYPGADPYVASVGSVTSAGVISDFTDTGTSLDLLAPGEAVPTTYTDDVTGQPVLLKATYTSFSSPFAAGAAALVHQANPSLTPTQILSLLQTTGQPATDPQNGKTYAIIDLDAALARAVHLAGRARHAAVKTAADTVRTTTLMPSFSSASVFNQTAAIRHDLGLFDDRPDTN